MVLPPTVNRRKRNANQCNQKNDKQAKVCGKKEKKTEKDKNEAPANNTYPHCKKSNAGSPIASNQTNACVTKNKKDTGSNPSETSLRWLSSHVTCFLAEMGGYTKTEDSESK